MRRRDAVHLDAESRQGGLAQPNRCRGRLRMNQRHHTDCLKCPGRPGNIVGVARMIDTALTVIHPFLNLPRILAAGVQLRAGHKHGICLLRIGLLNAASIVKIRIFRKEGMVFG